MVTPADSAELSFLGDLLADDVEQSIREALDAETVFPAGADPLSIYRATLAESIRDIEHHERGQLLQRFLRDGPQQDGTNVSPDMAAQRLSDEETAKAIAFIFGFMVSSFKGALMELLALGPCVRLMDSLKAEGHLSSSTRLYLGDSVLAAKSDRSHFAKGADLHMLSIESVSGKTGQVYVDGLVEVKSYVISQRRILRQLDRHLQRATLGLRVQGEEVDPRQVQIGHRRPDKAVLIAVVPSSWKLPRIPKFEGPEGRRFLRLEAPKPLDDDRIVHTANRHWRITLRWSQEAIASCLRYDVLVHGKGRRGDLP